MVVVEMKIIKIPINAKKRPKKYLNEKGNPPRSDPAFTPQSVRHWQGPGGQPVNCKNAANLCTGNGSQRLKRRRRDAKISLQALFTNISRTKITVLENSQNQTENRPIFTLQKPLMFILIKIYKKVISLFKKYF